MIQTINSTNEPQEFMPSTDTGFNPTSVKMICGYREKYREK
jgi:hypothetical protein